MKERSYARLRYMDFTVGFVANVLDYVRRGLAVDALPRERRACRREVRILMEWRTILAAKLRGSIRLICSGCGKEQDYDRDIDDDIPSCVKTIVSQCPECNGGDFGSEVWLDVVGREIDWETGKPF